MVLSRIAMFLTVVTGNCGTFNESSSIAKITKRANVTVSERVSGSMQMVRFWREFHETSMNAANSVTDDMTIRYVAAHLSTGSRFLGLGCAGGG